MRFVLLFICLFYLSNPFVQAQTGVYRYQMITGIQDTLTRSSMARRMVFSATESLDSAGSERLISKAPNSSWQPGFYGVGQEPTIYKNLETGRYLERRPGFRSTFIEDDSLPVIDWLLQKETRTIGGYVCLRADGDAYGRRWVAWYTPQIPTGGGPWRLHGLPGLILAAEDTTRQVILAFEGLDMPVPAMYRAGPFPEVAGQPHCTHQQFKDNLTTRMKQYAKLKEGEEPQYPPNVAVPRGTRSSWRMGRHFIDFSVVVGGGDMSVEEQLRSEREQRQRDAEALKAQPTKKQPPGNVPEPR
jgi:GLPGLI family protein